MPTFLAARVKFCSSATARKYRTCRSSMTSCETNRSNSFHILDRWPRESEKLSMNNQRIYLITGVSSGFGRAFASAALSAGHLVEGTLREENARKNFESEKPGFSKGIVLDVTDFDAIDPAVAEIEQTIGPISVLVNNAGYGHEGVIEESPLSELRRQFDVNVFGAVAMIKAVLPFMRKRRAGHIINITSMGGYITLPGIGYYCGSKFALEAISETLSKEVRDFGIRVSAIAPGQFRTEGLDDR